MDEPLHELIKIQSDIKVDLLILKGGIDQAKAHELAGEIFHYLMGLSIIKPEYKAFYESMKEATDDYTRAG